MSEAEPRKATGGANGSQDAAPDQEWFTLTEGMEPYERFRYIARHVLSTAINEATSYVDDERIFDNIEQANELEAHLEQLDDALRSDESLTVLEREFLCAAVSSAMETHNMQARCYGGLLKLARPVDPDPSDR